MQTLIFEDALCAQLSPLADARPACSLSIGSVTLLERLLPFGQLLTSLRPHLRRYLEQLGGTRAPLWGGPAFAADGISVPSAAARPAETESRHGSLLLVVNARVVPSRESLLTLRSLVEAGHRGIVHAQGNVAAALLHCSPTHDGPDDRLLQALLAGTAATDPTEALQDPTEALKAHDLVELDAMVDMIEWPHELVSFHELALAGSLAIRLDSGTYSEIRPGLFVAPEAHVADEVVVRQGPVVVETGAEIGPFVCLDGPLWIGPQTKVNPHAWLRAGSAIGAQCRVGGEIEASVMEPFSNKAHDGFLGHSHVGSWVNIAAGTITSNLKVSYGPIRLPARPGHPAGRVETGRQFLGALIGDLAKTGINTSFPCGATIGVAATVNGNVPACVEAFTTTLSDDGGGLLRRTTPLQAATGLERMMARRGVEQLPADRDLLQLLAEKA